MPKPIHGFVAGMLAAGAILSLRDKTRHPRCPMCNQEIPRDFESGGEYECPRCGAVLRIHMLSPLRIEVIRSGVYGVSHDDIEGMGRDWYIAGDSEPPSHTPEPSASRLVNEGIGAINCARYEEALGFLDEATKIDADYARGWYHKGNAFTGLGRFEEAIECYDRAIHLDQTYAGAWHRKGVALTNMGELSKAIECFDQALMMNPDFTEARKDKERAVSLQEEHARVLPEKEDTYPSCGPKMARSYFLSSPSCGESIEKKATKTGRRAKRKDDGSCAVCGLRLESDQQFFWCPHCGSPAHRTHFLEWLHVKARCPACGEELREEQLMEGPPESATELSVSNRKTAKRSKSA